VYFWGQPSLGSTNGSIALPLFLHQHNTDVLATVAESIIIWKGDFPDKFSFSKIISQTPLSHQRKNCHKRFAKRPYHSCNLFQNKGLSIDYLASVIECLFPILEIINIIFIMIAYF
jgi:hypothetical protein